MPLDLLQNRGPIDETDPTFHDVLGDLQGNILAGHGRFHAAHLFVSFRAGQAAALRCWVARFAANRVTSALDQAQAAAGFRREGTDAGVFAHFALSAHGYEALGFSGDTFPSGVNPRNREVTQPSALPVDPKPKKKAAQAAAEPAPPVDQGLYSDVFRRGMAARQPFLLDPPRGDWEPGYNDETRPIDALVLLAADDPAQLVAVERVVSGQLKDLVDVVASERGINLRKTFHPEDGPDGVAVEHFGYVDGRSQPLFLFRQVLRERPAGGGVFWDPRAPLGQVLVPDPNGAPAVSFGSFLVYRKLEQNVRGFKEAEAKLAAELGLPRELAGAMAVGRYEDGTPVALQPGDGARPIPNDFNYGGDPLGQTCPFHAHVRKSNPRLESVKFKGPFAQSVEEELGHRIARRGIPYGGPLSDSDSPDDLPTRGVGLLFFCYQADIWEQFEFIQRFWCDSPGFLQPGLGGPGAANYQPATGLDAVIGQSRPGQPDPVIGQVPEPPRNWPDAWGKPTTKVTTDFAHLVTLKGGEYLFSPCISFLKGLAHPDTPLPVSPGSPLGPVASRKE
jgi:Dyp-type peroxidase family